MMDVPLADIELWVDSENVHNGYCQCSIRFNPICQRSELLYFFFDTCDVQWERLCYHWHIESLDSEAQRHHTDDSLNASALRVSGVSALRSECQ